MATTQPPRSIDSKSTAPLPAKSQSQSASLRHTVHSPHLAFTPSFTIRLGPCRSTFTKPVIRPNLCIYFLIYLSKRQRLATVESDVPHSFYSWSTKLKANLSENAIGGFPVFPGDAPTLKSVNTVEIVAFCRNLLPKPISIFTIASIMPTICIRYNANYKRHTP